MQVNNIEELKMLETLLDKDLFLVIRGNSHNINSGEPRFFRSTFRDKDIGDEESSDCGFRIFKSLKK